MEKIKYNVGDLITLTKDFKSSTLLTNTPMFIPKGNTGIVMASTIGQGEQARPAVLFDNGYYVALGSEKHPAELSGLYNVDGMAAWLWRRLSSLYSLDDVFKDGDDDMITNDIVQTIAGLLHDLGFPVKESSQGGETNGT